MNIDFSKVAEAIRPQIDLQISEETDISEDQLLDAIRSRVEQLLEQDPALLFSYLYRLDVLEVDLKRVLSKQHNQNPIDSISTLILQRQKERLLTKEKYQQPPIEGWQW